MSVVDKFLNFMQLNDGDDEGYEDDYLDEDEKEEAPAPKKGFGSKAAPVEEDYDEQPAPARKPVSRPAASQNKIAPLHSGMRKSNSNGNGMEVCVIKPSSFEEAREITETLLRNRTIVMNLEGLDVDVAQRILDFTSGSCFAIRGNLQKISMYIFIITPASVDISGDFQNILGGVDSSSMNSGM